MASIHRFQKQLFRVASEKGFWLKILGVIDEYEMWLVKTRNFTDHKDPRVLIVAGFHGEEKAGPWGILKWLQDCEKSVFDSIDVSFIPIVNTYGFSKGKRYGSSDMKTNFGFCHLSENDKPSPEGEVLIKNIEILRPLAEDGFLSLHEDVTIKEFYLYTFEHGVKPGKFTRGLKKELKKHFKKCYQGIAYVDSASDGRGPNCKKGLIYKFCDGSFEDWLFHLGVPRVAVTETPGKYKLARRVKANVAIIDRFLKLCSSCHVR